MQTHDLVLNLHGEMTFTSSDVTEANAEAKFVPQLHKLHETFPRLRIVLEHVSSREGLEAVRQCGSNVRGTITAHHLWITLEDAERSNFNFCKPIAKVRILDCLHVPLCSSGNDFSRAELGGGNLPIERFLKAILIQMSHRSSSLRRSYSST